MSEALRVPTASRDTRLLPVAAVLASICCGMVGATFTRKLFPITGAAGATSLRLCLAALVLCAVMRPWRVRLRRTDINAVLLYGCVLGVMNLLFYLSLRTIPIGVAVAIEFIGPLTVAVLASRRAVDFAWILCAVAGLVLLTPLGGFSRALDPVGLACISGAAVCWGLYVIIGQRAGRLPSGIAVALGTSVAAIVVLPVGIASAGAAMLGAQALALGLTLAVMSSAIPYTLEMVALQRLPKQTFGILLSLEPAVAALAALAILGERLAPAQVLAIGLVVVASVGSTITARRPAALPCEG